MTLAEFLLVRIAEDEADARGVLHDLDKWTRELKANGADGSQGSILVTGLIETACDPTRVLAECEAKRRIAQLRLDLDASGSHSIMEKLLDPSAKAVIDNVLRILAQPYADHPDFRDEWRL
jgi:hypothetical protein